jgi:hypothetical protein
VGTHGYGRRRLQSANFSVAVDGRKQNGSRKGFIPFHQTSCGEGVPQIL